MKTQSSPALPRNAIVRAALAKLNECRAKCPGIGGDVDAMNLRAMIERGEWQRSTTDQAAHTLEHLSKSLDVKAIDEVAALRLLPLFEAAPEMRDTLKSCIRICDYNAKQQTLAAVSLACGVLDKTDNRFDSPLVTDGTDSNGDLAGDGKLAPFYVFDPIKQDNVAGPFETRAEADAVRAKMS